MQVFYVLDVAEAVQELMCLPEFAAARGTARTKDKIGTWWASKHYRDLNAATGGQLDQPNSSAFDLGVDGVELMTTTHCTTVAFLR